MTQPTSLLETLKLVNDSVAWTDGRKAPIGTFGATVSVLVRYLVWYFVTVKTLIFGLAVLYTIFVIVLAGVVVLVTGVGAGVVAAGVVLTGVAPLESASACDALAVALPELLPLLVAEFVDSLELPSAVLVVATSEGSKVPEAVVPVAVVAGVVEAGVPEGVPPLEPQPATASVTATAAIS